MNTTLATFLKAAFTVVVIIACIWGVMYTQMGTVADHVSSYISNR